MTSKLMDYYLFDAYPETSTSTTPKKVQVFVSEDTPYESVLQIAKNKSMIVSTNHGYSTSSTIYKPVLVYKTTLKTNGETRLDKN